MKGRDRFNSMLEARRGRAEVGPVRTRNKNKAPKVWAVLLTRPKRPKPWRYGVYRSREIAELVARKCERTYAGIGMRGAVLHVDDLVRRPDNAPLK